MESGPPPRPQFCLFGIRIFHSTGRNQDPHLFLWNSAPPFLGIILLPLYFVKSGSYPPLVIFSFPPTLVKSGSTSFNEIQLPHPFPGLNPPPPFLSGIRPHTLSNLSSKGQRDNKWLEYIYVRLFNYLPGLIQFIYT